MEWQIGRSGRECRACGDSFAPGTDFFSLLESIEENIVRSDYCAACFSTQDEIRKKVFWKTRCVEKGQEKKTVNFEGVRELFCKMLPVNEQAFKEITYLLALVLIRKRFLRLVDFTSRGGIDYMTVHQKKGDPLLHVEVPLLKEERIAEVREKLSGLLDADIDGSAEISEIRDKLITLDAASLLTEQENTGSDSSEINLAN